uniref:G-protein coupled receptors family 1 profile domain-containing protein n=1 Tax=Panagrolaimus superbus TaxID=310955 RepID=A0A914YN51_9BILA
MPERALSPFAMRMSLYVICIGGIILNIAVFCKRKFRTKRQSYTTRVSLQLLCFMAIADTISLASLLLVLCTQYLGIENETTMDMICKIDLFLIHSASAFSIWCWLILSAIRYIALYKPYAHLRLNKEPVLAVIFIAIISILFESWILYDATFVPEFRGCGEKFSEEVEKRFQIAEISWSYFLPLIIITVLDIKVLCCHSIWVTDWTLTKSFDYGINSSNNNSSKSIKRKMTVDECIGVDSSSPKMSLINSNFPPNAIKYTPSYDESPTATSPPISANVVSPGGAGEKERISTKISICSFKKSQTMFSFSSISQGGTAAFKSLKTPLNRQKSKKRQRQMKILRRCLCITLLDLGMNLPNYLFRLYVNLVPAEQLPNFDGYWFAMFQDISQLLYFAQFSLNAFYLVCIIYDTPKPKRSIYQNTNSRPSRYY